MSNQPNDQSNLQNPGSAQQTGDTNRTGQQQAGGSTGIDNGDTKKSGSQTQAAPPAKIAPANQPSGMPKPI